jgi:putative membrane protein
MRRRIVRSTIAGLLIVLASAFPAVGFVLAGQQTAQASDQGLRPVDREFLTVIKYANLWEIPMGKLATERGTTQPVKDVGATMFADHTQLNVDVKKIADQFGVTLPNEPTSSQKAWISEISSKTGADFDRTFANRLRGAHGTVFGLVAEIRSGASNEVIRDFATSANEIVMRHMTMLEATGLVDSSHMFAEASARTINYPENTLGGKDIILAIVVGFVALAGTLLVVRTLSTRGTAER